VPCRVVSKVFVQKLFDVGELAGPEFGEIELCEEPLAVGPGVVVLGVLRERGADEGQLRQGIAQLGDQESAVVPALVVFDEPFDDAVGPLELVVEREIESEQGFPAVLPASGSDAASEEQKACTRQSSGPG
jgi:hypothetical protein